MSPENTRFEPGSDDTFVEYAGGFRGAEIVDIEPGGNMTISQGLEDFIIPSAENSDKEISWQIELALLLTNIEKVDRAVNGKVPNPVAVMGFVRLYLKLKENLESADYSAGRVGERDPEGFIEECLALFKRSFEKYDSFKKRPGEEKKKRDAVQFQYDKFEGFLTPRQIRLVIYLNGLQGEEAKSYVEISKSEGIKVVKGVVESTENCLVNLLSRGK